MKSEENENIELQCVLKIENWLLHYFCVDSQLLGRNSRTVKSVYLRIKEAYSVSAIENCITRCSSLKD